MFTVYRNAHYKISEISKPQAHNCRQKNVPNADASRSHLNISYCTTPGDFTAAVKKRCSEVGVKITKSARCLAEHVVTASPEFFQGKEMQEISDWMDHALEFFYEKYGKENIIAYDLHMDEKEPHLHIMHVPLCHLKGVKVANPETGKKQNQQVYSEKLRLNFDGLLGGSKYNQSKLQDEVAEHMQIKYPELARGISKTQRKVAHDRVQEWYSNVEKTGQKRIEKILNRFQQIQNTPIGGLLGKIKKLDVINQTREKADRFDEMSEFITDELKPQLESVFEQLKILQDDNKRLKYNESHSADRIRELEQSDVMQKIEQLESQVEELAEKNVQYQASAHRLQLQLQDSRKEVTELKSENRSLSERISVLTADANKRINESIERAVEKTRTEMHEQIERRVEDALRPIEHDYNIIFTRLATVARYDPEVINRNMRKINIAAYARTEEQLEYASLAGREKSAGPGLKM